MVNSDVVDALESRDDSLGLKRDLPSEGKLKLPLPHKKRKLAKIEAIQSGAWTQCMYFISKKQRYCNLQRVPGSKFCGHHCNDAEGVSSKTSLKHDKEKRKRIPCPVDPSHTVYVYDLKKHVTICNAKTVQDAKQNLPYYTEDINSGKSMLNGDNHGVQTVPTNDEQSLLDRLSKIDFKDLVRRINRAFESAVGDIPTEVLEHTSCSNLVEQKEADGGQRVSIRHITQQSSILAHMKKQGWLLDQNTFIELGAGRGGLSHALVEAVPKCQTILVDRSHSRRKADNKIREKGECKRVYMDIRHLNLRGMSEIFEKPIVCMSKHLCGVATDLSLRCIMNTLPSHDYLEGIAIALCCHHACTWDDYVNQEYFLDLGFSQKEFELICSIGAWCTSDFSTDGKAVEKYLSIGKVERKDLGRKCKRILDIGRLRYLLSFRLNTRIVHYCDEKDSPENALLLAWKNS